MGRVATQGGWQHGWTTRGGRQRGTGSNTGSIAARGAQKRGEGGNTGRAVAWEGSNMGETVA